ncbi:MAG: Nif3-like dinuclear metal center hexameric protein [Deltaproteobacteria bacterium]|nr:Nif3-like dinuclear metal center hexameric protein [Deltaproteobacteria bacterium]
MTAHTDVVAALERIAPPQLAASWDNVGLLVEPLAPRAVRRVLLTIDLTEPVFAEAQERSADFIVSYHPPIFAGIKRLTAGRPMSRVVLGAIAAGIPIYSPHTALDAAPHGMNDWLLDALGPMIVRRAIQPAPFFEDVGGPAAGVGRIGELAGAEPLSELIRRLKAWLDLPYVRVATPDEHAAGRPLKEVAVCPGAGGAVFEGMKGIELFVTGEMRHHDVLNKVAEGSSVILTEHTNCERGYLGVLARRLHELLDGVEVMVSAVDQDPLRVV